ncbi:MAG: Fic family protein [Treponemataceae bacterium]|nr:MAG: Fic family protein [Treponemataceae bacterium]
MSKIENKFTLTREQSLFLAKKKWDENIYCGMKMENRNVTFPETQTILQGVNVGRLALDDIQAILNMRDGWRYVLDTLDAPLDLAYLCRLNGFVSRQHPCCHEFSHRYAYCENSGLVVARRPCRAGGKCVLRTGAVGISGTVYTPPLPDEEKARRELAALVASGGNSPTENATATAPDKATAIALDKATAIALDIFLWCARAQLFWDGNKRTSLLAANKVLVCAGCGVLTITDPFLPEFNTLLTQYYETGNGEDLRQFLFDNAISGIEFCSMMR